jgi:AmmeMemoRadiSam system protein B
LIAHRREHSLEFQTVFLAHRYGAERLKILPILCTTLDDLMRDGKDPREVPEVSDFLAALTESVAESGKSVLYVAGADLSHVGRQFGDDVDVRGDLASRVETSDGAALAALGRADADAFFAAVAANQNQYRICSVACLYSLLAAAGTRRGQVLHYEQAIDANGHSLVSFAAAVFE